MVVRALLQSVAGLAALMLVACQAPNPVRTQPSFRTTPALAVRNPIDIAVLPLEDGTPSGAAVRHLVIMRQTLERQLPERLYSPLTASWVDARLASHRRNPGETLLSPSWLKRIAGQAGEDAALAVRVERWDEGNLLSDRKVRFQFEAVLIAADGEVLWSGTLTGEVKAGGVGAAPRDRDGMARSCAELALTELLQQLPPHTP